jgi:2-hydroxychromene-2-carboxylate isomerase
MQHPRVLIGRALARLATSARLRALRRGVVAWRSRLQGGAPTLHYFHQPDDPYSRLLAQLLPRLQERYRVDLQTYRVAPPDAAAAPERERLQAWSRRDARRLAGALGLDPDGIPDIAGPDGTALRRRLGHYLGATLHFEGEWTWGVDRLHHLERRLAEAGLARPPQFVGEGLLWPAPALQWQRPPAAARTPTLHFYVSLRSPYTYLAIGRVRRLAEHYGAALQLRFVLPMVMRGLAVPLAKRLYIVRDAKREAERLGLRFGDIADPVGVPTERGLAVLHHAIAQGRGAAFAESFLQGVFAEGLDAGSRRGLLAIAARAGVGTAAVDAALADPSWRAVAEANRRELLALGLWGVPSFRVDDRPALWGQDRLWMLEQDLLDALAA